MNNLTPRQLEVLKFCLASVRDCGQFPSIRELGDGLGIRSTNGVSEKLHALERKGLIARVGDGGVRARGWRITARGYSALEVRLPRFAEARAALLDAATEVASLFPAARAGMGHLAAATEQQAAALVALHEANEHWQQALLIRGAA